MAYQINKTDGTIVATVADGQVDTLSTDLTLIGKNYSGFGEAFNENLIKLLENFSSTTSPTHAIAGQIWFDTSESKLKVYNGIAFIPVSSATIAGTQPGTLGIGDLWFNSTDAQLYFYDGTTPILLGPAYAASQSLSGLRVDSILDTLNQTRVVTSLYNNGILLGIFAKDSFTPKNEIIGFTGNIAPGFNAGSLSGLKFNVTATNSDSLGGVVSTTYVRKDTANSINGQLTVSTDLGVIIGSGGQLNLTVNNGDVIMSNSATDKNFKLNVRNGISQEDAIVISSSTRSIDLYDGFADSEISVGGNLTVVGNLTVEGTTTTVNSTTLTVDDKNIELASTATPSDTNANGGGITLKGTTDHTLIWTQASTAWNSSEHINIAVGKEFKINGVTVLSGSSLGSGITAIPGVTSFGKQTVVNVGPGTSLDPAYMRLQDNNISTVSGDLDIELEPDGNGNIALIGSPYITGLADPPDGDGYEQYAATREYVDNKVELRNLLFSMDLSDGKPNSYIITNILNNLAPIAYYRLGTTARILCTSLTNNTVSLDLNTLLAAGKSTAVFNTPTMGTASAVTNYSIATATVPSASITTARIIKEFYLSAGGWVWVSDTILPP
jgi:hypothetical protein